VADLEQRVATLEHEMTALKGRVGIMDEDTKSIPDLIKMEFRLAGSQNARVSRDITDLQRNVGELQRNVGELQRNVGELQSNVEAMPRAVAELVVELLGERDKRR
jgi:predicted RNase H-like nuclease (RuvC/YqgF family)